MTRARLYRSTEEAAAHPELGTKVVLTTEPVSDLETSIRAKVRWINEALGGVPQERVLLLEEELGKDFHNRHYKGRAALVKPGTGIGYDKTSGTVTIDAARTVVYEIDTNRGLTHQKTTFTDPIKMRQDEFARAVGLTQSREAMYVGTAAVRSRLGTANYQTLMNALKGE